MTTETCPPHHWIINPDNHGVCRKCGAKKEWPRHASLLHGASWTHRAQESRNRAMNLDEDRWPEISHYDD